MTPTLKTIKPQDFIAADDLAKGLPLRVDLVYAQENHPLNMFHECIYRKDARMWIHRELAPVITRAAELCFARGKYILELKDCLRTCEAQQKICDSAIVRAHPEWLEEPRLFSPPGKGAHPRGMAIDAVLIDENGDTIDMGTPFDYLTDDKNHNPAARDFKNFGKGAAFDAMVTQNRQLLENSMRDAAAEHGIALYPLPQEWWDFRLMPAYTEGFAPVYDADLPAHMKMT